MKLEEAIAISGDSTLMGFVYDGAAIKIRMDLGCDDQPIMITIPTGRVFSETPSSDDRAFTTCRIEYSKLAECLEAKNGRYIAPSEFPDLMSTCRKGLGIAFGLKADDWEGLFMLKGSTDLLICAVKSADLITIDELTLP